MAVPALFESLTLSRQKALAICPKVAGLLSMGGTVYIFLKIFASNRLNRPIRPEVVYNRLLLGLSIGDFAYAFAYFLSTWPVPKDTLLNDYIWGNIGNQATCNFQGNDDEIYSPLDACQFMMALPLSIFHTATLPFLCHCVSGFFQLWGGLMAVVYISSLSLYFLLAIRYKWSLERLRKIEPAMHGLSWVFASVASAICVFKGLTNPVMFGCGIQSYPLKCNSSKGVPCIRGEHAVMYQMSFVIAPVLAGLFCTATCMIMIYVTVRKRQSAAAQFRKESDTTSETVSEQIREDFRRAWQFIGVFFLISMPIVVSVLAFAQKGTVPFIISMVRANVCPLQGFLNAIVFSQDIEGELIRSIWDTSIQTRNRAPAAQRAMPSKLSIVENNRYINQKNTSVSDDNDGEVWLEHGHEK